MKLEASDTVETYSIGSDISDKKSSINEENIPLVLQLVSKGIYSNPIGSIIREIASNCVDAHTELGVKKPILVNINYDVEENSYYIEFIDKGIGMSPDRMDNVYSNFFSSTKRATDSLIGGFGLGSKSLLSYTDIFYITTIYDNIKYEYVYYKDGDDYILSLLNRFNVLEKSGTTIKMYIKSGDESKFIKEINQQLSYFDDVYININYSYQSYDNDFTIYEGNHFKFKSENRPYDVMHILLGQVTYPIDFKELNIKPIQIPIALKFKIGELKPTLERENIKYESKYIKAIKDKIELASAEIKEYFKDQTFELTDLREYLKKREETPYLYFNKEKDHKIKAYREYFDKSTYVYKPLENVRIPPYEHNIFFMYNVYRIQSEEKVSPVRMSDFIHDWKYKNIKILTKKESGFNAASNSYFGDDAYILVPKKVSYRECILNLDLISPKYNYQYRSSYTESFYARLHNRNTPNTYLLGNSKIIYKYLKGIQNYINSISTNYEDVPLDYIENYREEKRRQSQELRNKNKEKVTFIDQWGSYQHTTIEKLFKHKYVFYYLKGECYNVNLYKNILAVSHFKPNDFAFIGLSETQYKKIRKYKLTHIKEFLEMDELQNTLYKIKLANYIDNKMYQGDTILPEVSKYHYKIKKDLIAFSNQYTLDLEKIKINTHRRKMNVCWEITAKFEEYLKVRNNFDILKYVTFRNLPEKYLKIITKTIKLTKLNSNLYK